MCSIYGAFGSVDDTLLASVSQAARDRGRDGSGVGRYTMPHGEAVLGSHRAAPTTETQSAPPQPYDGVVHNGTISNDAELGNPPGTVDSAVLPRVLDRSSATGMAASLTQVAGSYAIAAAGADRVFLASNYKPLHYVKKDSCIYFASMERHLAGLAAFGTRPARVRPYTVVDLLTGEVAPIRREQNNKALVVCSSGLDSTTAAYELRWRGHDVTLLHFEYDCLAQPRELERIRAIADRMGAACVVLKLDYSSLRGASPLFRNGSDISGPVSGAEFAHEWVPARNLVMLAHAVAYAEANGFSYVAIGNNLEEAGAYPDNEEEFTHLLDQALDYAVHDGGYVRVLSPLGHLMKHEIVKLGHALGVPFELTWSCYRNGDAHCGQCGPCFMRRTAFDRNGLVDPVFT